LVWIEWERTDLEETTSINHLYTPTTTQVELLKPSANIYKREEAVTWKWLNLI
jgi:hypothetical protein